VHCLAPGAKTRAAVGGEYNVTVDHVRRVAPLALRHLVRTNFRAAAERMTPDKVVKRLLEDVWPPRSEDDR